MEDPDGQSAWLEAAMDVPVSVSLGPMGALLRQLQGRPKGVGDDKIQLLKDYLGGLCISLKDLSEAEDQLDATTSNLMSKWWMKEVRELCYDTEDYLDQVRRRSGAPRRRRRRSRARVSTTIFFRVGSSKLEWRPQIATPGRRCALASRLMHKISASRRDLKRRRRTLAATGFSGLMARVEALDDTSERFKICTPEPDANVLSGRRFITAAPQLQLQPHTPNRGPGGGRTTAVVVGVEEPVNKLADLLAFGDDKQKQLKVVSVFGSAGVGKTTAAKALYHDFGDKFQCRAFVRVSRTPDMMRLLASVHSQTKAPPPPVRGFPDAQDLIDSIKEHLQGKRYFIIIADLWATSVWNIISRAFPDGECCSRILTTTKTKDLALACCSYHLTNIFQMSPLNDDQSRKLFFSRVFGSEDGCPPTFKGVSYEIIRKCGGSPFAAVNIANLLARQDLVMEQWKHIQDSLSSIVSTSPTSEGMKQVLNLIYSYLPPHLKTCLLHLAMYPEGYTVRTHDLVKQWVAEGFLGAMKGKDAEEIAGGYLDELVSNGMVQAVDTNYNGEVLSCTVHHMVLDFVKYKSMEENFVITVDNFQSTVGLPDKVRRLSVQFGGAKSAEVPEGIIVSHVRSLLFCGFFKCIPSIVDYYGLLRVLVLHVWADEDKIVDLSRIHELHRLTYLQIKCNTTIKLPAKIRGLKYLATLEVDARISGVPSDIVHLDKLLHLRVPSESNLLHLYGVGHMTSLCTLGYLDLGTNSQDNVIDLGKLTNLRDLQLTYSTVQSSKNLEKNVQLLGSILEKLSILRSVTLAPSAGSSHLNSLEDAGASSMSISCDNFNSVTPAPANLERIELLPPICIFPSLPKWFEELGKLCILKIAVRVLSREDIGILKALPALTALSVYVQTALVERAVFEKEGFLVLKYFEFRCSVPLLEFEAGAMPNLLKLKLLLNAHRVDKQDAAAISIQRLSGLEELFAKTEGSDAKDVLTVTVRNHAVDPIISIQFLDCVSHGDPSTGTENIQLIPRGDNEEEDKKEQPMLSSSSMLIPGFDINVLLKEASTRWLKPSEVIVILWNHECLPFTHEPPNNPSNGSLFLYNRRVNRNFQKDGYAWRRKKDGRVGEAHERLKVGNLDSLSCYYAQGEENPCFQRRCYWMLEAGYDHIVLVHYREVAERIGSGSSAAGQGERGKQSTAAGSRGDGPRQSPRHLCSGSSLDFSLFPSLP